MSVEKQSTGSTSYASPKLYLRPTHSGLGMFCLEPIAKGEVLAVFGGMVCTFADLQSTFASLKHLSLQVEEDLYLVPTHNGDNEHFNHSCSPNAGFRGQVSLVALRSIAVGEEIAYDYAMSDGSPYDEFDCRCGSPECRGRITGEDWKLPELRHRYGQHFSTYLLTRLAQLST